MTCLDLEKIARLSHLKFTDEEKNGFIKDMTQILSFTEKLCELDDTTLFDSENTTSTPLAKDEPVENPCSLLLKRKNFDGKYIIVPNILE